jgi:spermidine synthase
MISIEVSSIWFAGSTNLYSAQFYELARKRMRPGAVLQQWIQFHHISTAELLSVVGTARTVFPQVSLWFFGGQGLILASTEPQVVQAGAVERILGAAPRLGLTEEFARTEVSGLLRSRLLAPATVDRLFREVRFVLNTDQNRYLEYSTPRYNLVRSDLLSGNVKYFADFAAGGAKNR